MKVTCETRSPQSQAEPEHHTTSRTEQRQTSGEKTRRSRSRKIEAEGPLQPLTGLCRFPERRALHAKPARGGERPTMDREGQDAARREAEVERGRYLDRRAVAQEQLAQIKEHKHQAELAKLENKREGEQIQRLNQLYHLEIQRGKEKEQEEKTERQRLHHEHVAEQKIIKAEKKQKDDDDDDRIKAYIKEKEMMAHLSREKDAETNRLIQQHKDKAFDQLTAQMNEACKIEDDRLARGAAEVEDEYQMKNKEKEAKKKAAIESIAEHRATVMKMKVEKEREEKAEDEKDRNQWMTADRIYLEMEKARKQRQHDANMEVQKIQIQQMAEKRAKKQQEKQADLDYDAQREAAFHKDCAFQR
ncbi:cilia- and flagella- associated protein 210-like isoform X2 [Balearica regulorum gibbericeps]|uniref:cilia- and flagella- associated protein 210-like isoform X2 n=1 Tax=Balearica regulorum gibbericeps TaxID=100784 RepID=UPI003F5DAE8D